MTEDRLGHSCSRAQWTAVLNLLITQIQLYASGPCSQPSGLGCIGPIVSFEASRDHVIYLLRHLKFGVGVQFA